MTIDDVCHIKTGKLDSNAEVIDGSYPFFTCAAHPTSIDHYAYDDDVILIAGNNAQGNFHVNRYKGRFNAYQRTYILSQKGNNNLDFTHYALKLLLRLLKERSQGSQTKFLTMAILKGLELPFHSSNDRIKIAHLLKTLDKKIELNNKINTELESMAKLIYDYWFVQFDFPITAEQAASMGDPSLEGKPYKSSGGPMTHNKTLKREIPEGWSDTQIDSVLAKTKRTQKLPKDKYLEKGPIPIIDQSTSFICGYTDESEALIKVKNPFIVFGDHTRIVKFINFDFARGADGTQILQSCEALLPQHLFYQMVNSIDLSNYGYARHFKFLKEKHILLPDESISAKFEDLVTPFYNSISSNRQQNQQLTELRDWLLPMLMNGQVTVSS